MDSEALSTLSLSATWKTKPRPVRFWRRELETGVLTMLRSGLTSAPSIQNRGVDSYRSWLAGSHASRSVLPVNASNRRMKEISGPMSPESSTVSNQIESSWKMLQASFGITTNESGQTYEQWVTQLRKDSSRRQRRAHLTGGRDSLSWPTPNASDQYNPNLKDNHDVEKQYLRGVAANWPTPNTRDCLLYTSPSPRDRQKSRMPSSA